MQDFPNPPKSWQVKTLGECLDYEQPTKYIVKSTKYDDSYKTPVLTAGKSFILGYTDESDGIFTQTPVIIFDDFTTDTKFVDFDFKVKSSAMKILHPKENIDIKFVYYLMQTIQYRSDTHKRYWISQYAKIKIPIPPLEIQRRIVKRLDEAFVRIENGTKHLKSAKDNLAKYKQSLLKSAFNGTLTQDCPLSLGESTAESSLRENPQGFSWQSTHSLSQGESANLPQDWTIKTLGEVCDIIMGQSPLGEKVIHKSKNTDSKALEFHQGKICFTDKFISESEVVTTDIRKIAPKDSILLCVRAPVGVVNITQRRIAIGRGLCALNLKDSSNDFLYFYLLTLNNYFNQKATGSTFSAINLDTIKNTKIPIPPLEIQRQIVAILEKHFTSADKVSAYIDSCLSKAKQLKSSLLKSAFDGTLTNESTHPLAPSAGEGEIEDSPRAMEGEHYSCHTERSEVSKSKSVDLQNHLDSSVAPLPQNDNDRNNVKVPSLCGGDLGVGGNCKIRYSKIAKEDLRSVCRVRNSDKSD